MVFSGRQFPFITELADINEFDHDKYEILEMNKRLPIVEESIDVDLEINEKTEEKSVECVQEDEYDLQKELERKFDELFGPLMMKA